MSEVFTLHRGTLPVLVSVPHDGTQLPRELAARLSPRARTVPDTDWHVARLYEPVRAMGASMIVPRFSRYLVDLNRPADGAALYPGRAETGLVPTLGFDGAPLYASGDEPAAAEIAERVQRWWRPYHEALAAELSRLRAAHGRVLLWEGHTIRSEVPMFFEGRLPDFNLGTADGSTCRPEVREALRAALARIDGHTHVVDGRFKGGYITRHYADPPNGIDAVQLELAQRTYCDERDFRWNEVDGARIQRAIRALVEVALAA